MTYSIGIVPLGHVAVDMVFDEDWYHRGCCRKSGLPSPCSQSICICQEAWSQPAVEVVCSRAG